MSKALGPPCPHCGRAMGQSYSQLLVQQAESKVAGKLGISRSQVQARALALWARPLIAERDARLPDGKRSARTTQAIRGHVMRLLIEELRTAGDAA